MRKEKYLVFCDTAAGKRSAHWDYHKGYLYGDAYCGNLESLVRGS